MSGRKFNYINAYAVASGAISILSVAGRRGSNGPLVTKCGQCRSQRDKPYYITDRKNIGDMRLRIDTGPAVKRRRAASL